MAVPKAKSCEAISLNKHKGIVLTDKHTDIIDS
jgi:hypothetical protein